MSIFNKLGTLLRGKASEAGEAVVDKHAITILEQEIRDAKTHLEHSRRDLTKVMADKTVAENQRDELQQEADTWLEHARNAKRDSQMESEAARNAKADGNEDLGNSHNDTANKKMKLAEECAEKVASLRDQIATRQQEVDALAQSVTRLEKTINETANQIKTVEQRINSIKANERVQKAQASLSRHANHASGSMGSALDTLDRIDAKQQHRAAELDASASISRDPDSDLKARLEKSGIGKSTSSAASILDEI